MEGFKDPFNVLTVANSIGTAGYALWSYNILKKLTIAVDELSKEVETLKTSSAKSSGDINLISTGTQRIAREIEAVKVILNEVDPEILLDRVDYLEEEAKKLNSEFRPPKRYRRGGYKSKSRKSKRKSKVESSSEEEDDYSSEEEYVERKPKKGEEVKRRRHERRRD